MLCAGFWALSALQAQLMVFLILTGLLVIAGIAYYQVHHGSGPKR